MSVEFFVTAVAVTIGSVVRHERLSVPQLAGAVVIIAGCALVLGLVSARSRRNRSAPTTLSAPVAQDP
jgi:drug/metabolite transporter (DMT)-like permease